MAIFFHFSSNHFQIYIKKPKTFSHFSVKIHPKKVLKDFETRPKFPSNIN
jgi:hypothetical protein